MGKYAGSRSFAQQFINNINYIYCGGYSGPYISENQDIPYFRVFNLRINYWPFRAGPFSGLVSTGYIFYDL